MRKSAVLGILGLSLAIGLLCCQPARAAGNVRFYLGGEGVYSLMNFQSGGHNSAGGFDNTDSDLLKTFRPGAHLGLEIQSILNIDFGFHHRAGLKFTTDSFPGFWYQTDVDAYSLMFSLFLTPFPSYVISPYIGGGAGGTRFSMKTDDTEVYGDVENTGFTWQAEAGLRFEPMANFSLRIGYRYLHLGKSELDLTDSMGWPAGNFIGDMAAHEIVAGVRVTF